MILGHQRYGTLDPAHSPVVRSQRLFVRDEKPEIDACPPPGTPRQSGITYRAFSWCLRHMTMGAIIDQLLLVLGSIGG